MRWNPVKMNIIEFWDNFYFQKDENTVSIFRLDPVLKGTATVRMYPEIIEIFLTQNNLKALLNWNEVAIPCGYSDQSLTKVYNQ